MLSPMWQGVEKNPRRIFSKHYASEYVKPSNTFRQKQSSAMRNAQISTLLKQNNHFISACPNTARQIPGQEQCVLFWGWQSTHSGQNSQLVWKISKESVDVNLAQASLNRQEGLLHHLLPNHSAVLICLTLRFHITDPDGLINLMTIQVKQIPPPSVAPWMNGETSLFVYVTKIYVAFD